MVQELYQNAMKFAGEKHCHQKMTGSASNYLLHLSNVAMEVLIAHKELADFDLGFAIQVAILHDVIEDTDTAPEEIEELFGAKVKNGVLALTKNKTIEPKEERMIDSLKRINKETKEVGLVKLADRITNLQQPPPTWAKSKIKAYHQQAKIIANQLVNKNQYLHNRLETKIEEYEHYFN